MRVLHVIDQFCDGAGAEISLTELLRSAPAGQIANGLVVLEDARNDFSRLAGRDVEIFLPRRSAPTRAENLLHVSRAIRSFRPDVVTTALFEANTLGRLAARVHGVPVVTSVVGMPWANQEPSPAPVRRIKLGAVRATDRMLARHATSRFHAVAESVADASAAALGVDRRRFEVVRRGRDPDRLGRRSPERRSAVRRSLEDELARPLQGAVLLAVGREEPAKNHLFLLPVLAELRRRRRDVSLLIAGRRGTSSTALDEAVRAHRLEDHVVRMGHRSDVPDLLAAADVFVFPSLHEGAAGAVIEAMALEVPIVAASSPSLVEALDGGTCGALAPALDALAFADAVERALAPDPVTQRRIAEGRRRFEAHHDQAVVSASMVDLYRSVASGRPR